jgi:hypothetical protein
MEISSVALLSPACLKYFGPVMDQIAVLKPWLKARQKQQYKKLPDFFLSAPLGPSVVKKTAEYILPSSALAG